MRRDALAHTGRQTILSPNETLAHYRLVEKIGAGGMGEVWKAVDTSLDREVAIKVLPDAFAMDAERLARFEREARLLASLSHSGIATVHGLHEHEGHKYLAMELVPGEDLSQRLARGPMRVEEALFVCLQVAEALEAAHAQGVIHRDLKPANVVLTPDGKAKVLDFGLAKAFEADPSSPSTKLSRSPTMTSEGTVAGVILGTAAYMSPEQARGKTVDKKTDIWSFGCVLYECLTGVALYKGESVSDSIGAILHKEPDWSLLPANTPPSVHLLLRRCLTKQASNRLQDVGDARIELQAAIADPTSSALNLATAALASSGRGRRASLLMRALPWAVAAVLLAALVVVWSADDSEPRRVTKFSVQMEEGVLRPIGQISISPDGRAIAYSQIAGETPELRIRSLDQLASMPLPGVTAGVLPIFSPDGEWIAYEWEDKLMRVSVRGGPPTTICDTPRLRGATWGPDDTIVLAPEGRGELYRVLAAGGEPEPLTSLDAGVDARSHRLPSFLPDGRAVLFTAEGDWQEETAIMVHSLDSGETKLLVRGGIQPRYSPTGHVIFYRDGTLMAASFDAAELELTGPAVPVLEGVARSWWLAQYALSDEGTLVYVPGTSSSSARKSTLVWRDSVGTEEPLTGLERDFGWHRISPEGERVAVEIDDNTKDKVWILELDRDVLRPLTFGDSDDETPVWSPDGQWVAFASSLDGNEANVFRVRADFTGEPERLTTSELQHRPTSWSPDGSTLALTQSEPDSDDDIYLLRFDESGEVVGEPEPFAVRPADEFLPTFSRDSRWLGYNSNESGELEVYVRPLSGPGGAIQISTDGGFMPHFSPTEDRIFYLWRDGLYSVTYETSDGRFDVSPPEKMFDLDAAQEFWIWGYDIAPDGKSFSFGHNSEIAAGTSLPVVVLNWFEELHAKTVPVRR